MSSAAPQCLNCGHPIARIGVAAPVKFAIVILFLLAMLVIAWRLYGLLIMPASTELGSTPTEQPEQHSGAMISQNERGSPRLAGVQLSKEIQSYVMRLNRLTPYKPSESVTLQRVRYAPKSNEVAYEYELNAASTIESLPEKVLLNSLTNRYCTSEELSLFAAHSVAVSFEYYKAGRRLISHRVSSCEGI